MQPGTIVEEKVKRSSGEISIRTWQIGRYLGKGGFARVYEMSITGVDGKPVDPSKSTVMAGKIVDKSSLAKNRAKQKLISEIKIHKQMQHKYIVGFQSYFEDQNNVYILLELCKYQSMNEMIRKRKRLTELEVAYYMH